MNHIVLHLVRSEYGGAGQYSMNIHQRMLELGYTSYVSINGKRLVCPDGSEIPIKTNSVSLLWNKFRRLAFKWFVKWFGDIDPKYVGYNLYERFLCHSPKELLKVIPQKPTDIMVHWVSGYANAKYVSDLQEATNSKVYYWMIDEAPLSGACHYPWDCQQYKTGCGSCPMTTSSVVKKAIRKNFQYKKQYLVKDRIMVLPTEFDKIRAEQSLLWKGVPHFKMIEIVDEERFRPANDVEELRRIFDIPMGKKVVFFGCWNLEEERKGMSTLMSALSLVKREDVVYLVAGGKSDFLSGSDMKLLGYVDIPTLIKAYQVSDLFVCSSLEDSGPQMINQSIMCGTPVVAFAMGVALDIVKTGETGYLAKWNDAEDMALGINMILNLSPKEYHLMATQCREIAMDIYSKSVFGQSIEKILNL